MMAQFVEQLVQWECDTCGLVVDSQGAGPMSLPGGWKQLSPSIKEADLFCSWRCLVTKATELADSEDARAQDAADARAERLAAHEARLEERRQRRRSVGART